MTAGWELDPRVIGSFRSLEPIGALPHLAARLDARTGPNEHELAVAVDRLHVDATSYRQLRAACGGDAAAMAERIMELVADQGKLVNPVTGSGGVARGRVFQVGARARAAVAVGDLVVPLVSLIALPLLLDSVGPLDPADPEVPVSGRAIVTGLMPVLRIPDDLEPQGLTAADVYPVASYVRTRARSGDHVLVLGAGSAGMLAAVAAVEQVGSEGHVSVLDVSAAALAQVGLAAPTAVLLQQDARDPVAAAGAVRDAGLPRADLTMACTSARGCEGTAVLVTKDSGTVVFFSTATSFAAASLGTDPVGVAARLELSNGVTPDHGQATFELLRGNAVLRQAFAGKGSA